MPLSVWLGFPEGFLVSCYQIDWYGKMDVS